MRSQAGLSVNELWNTVGFFSPKKVAKSIRRARQRGQDADRLYVSIVKDLLKSPEHEEKKRSDISPVDNMSFTNTRKRSSATCKSIVKAEGFGAKRVGGT